MVYGPPLLLLIVVDKRGSREEGGTVFLE